MKPSGQDSNLRLSIFRRRIDGRARNLGRVANPGACLALPLACIIAACAPLPTVPPEVRTTTVQVQVPVPVPCFTDDQRPIQPKATPIDPETATTEQLAAAELADAEAWRDYTRAVDALFVQCSSKGTTP